MFNVLKDYVGEFAQFVKSVAPVQRIDIGILRRSPMRIPHRPMSADDVGECANLTAKDPIVSARYGPLLKHLPDVWLRLLGRESFRAWVFPAPNSAKDKLVALGISAMVSDAFVARLKTPPLVWIGPELARRILHKQSPLLSDREVANANSGAGLNVVV